MSQLKTCSYLLQTGSIFLLHWALEPLLNISGVYFTTNIALMRLRIQFDEQFIFPCSWNKLLKWMSNNFNFKTKSQ